MKTYRLFLILPLLPFFVFAQNPEQKRIVLPDTSKKVKKEVQLKDVEIRSKIPLLQVDVDKTIVNVGSMISSASSNTLEVLSKTPGVQVSATGDISLNGRSGILVLIDGKQTYLGGQDLAAYLKAIPGSSLDKIELMDNPPARYDAAGNAIINIRLKKNKVAGFTGSLSTGYSQGRYARNNNSLNLNYSSGKINLFGNLGYSYEKSYTDDVFNRQFSSAAAGAASVILNNADQGRNRGLNANLGLDYAATDLTTYGLQLNVNKGKRNGLLSFDNQNYANQNFTGLSSRGFGFTGSDYDRRNLTTSVNFLHKFGKTGKELSAEANYMRSDAENEQTLENELFTIVNQTTDRSAFLYQLPSGFNVYGAKADYVQPIGKNARVEAGVKMSTVQNDNQASYYEVVDQQQLPDYSRSNHFIYHENIQAAYVSGQQKWKQFAVQLGLRAEQTQSEGEQLGNAQVASSRFSKSYVRLFPSLFLNYKLDSLNKHTLNFSITRRINRPNYQLLNPFTTFRDQYSYTSGNPDLVPQYQYRYELKYSYKQKLRIGLSYNRFSNGIFQTTNVVNNVYITRPENIAKGYMLLLNTGLTLAPADWWSLNSDVLLSRIGLKGVVYGEDFNPETYVARINLMNQFQFEKGWSAELGGYYASRDMSGQAFTAGMFRSNAGIQKRILKNKGSLRLSMDDIFHTWKYENRSVSLKQASFYQTSESDTQRIGFAFTYSFGNDLFKRKSKYNNNALDEEKGRM